MGAVLLVRPGCAACVEAEPKVRVLFDRFRLTLTVRDVQPEEDIWLPGVPALVIPQTDDLPPIMVIGSRMAEQLEAAPDLLDRLKGN